MERSGSTCRFGNAFVEATLDLTENGTGCRLTSQLNRITGRRFDVEVVPERGEECVARLAGAGAHVDVPEWLFCLGSVEDVPPDQEEGYRPGYHLPEFDVSDWLSVTAINEYPVGAVGYTTVVYPEYACYRQNLSLPPDGTGQSVSIIVGGSDDQDWLEYRVYLNGILVGHAAPGVTRWHSTPALTLRPCDDAYSAARFGAANTLAIQAWGLDRRSPRMIESNLERFSVGTPLFEQFVAIGAPYRDVADFRLVSHRTEEEPDLVAVELDPAKR